MIPSDVRPLLQRFVIDRAMGAGEFARAFAAIETAAGTGGDRLPPRLSDLAGVVHAFLAPAKQGEWWKPTPDVVAGVARDAYASIPDEDAAPTLATVLERLRGLRASVETECRYRIEGVFGSVARGEATVFSDVDILVSPVERADLGRLVRAEERISRALRRRADLFDRGLHTEAAIAQVTRDLVRL